MSKTFSNPSTEAILRFNQTPYQVQCRGEGCSQTATRCTVNRGCIDPFYWCDKCNAYQAGAIQGRISPIFTYSEAVEHVNKWFKGNTSVLRRFLDELAEAKGLPRSAL